MGHERSTFVSLCFFVVKTLTSVFRVSHRPTISHGFLTAAPTDVRQARLAAAIDALPAAGPVDGPQAEAPDYVHVLAAVAEAVCQFAAADYAAALSVSTAHRHYWNALRVRAAPDGRHARD
jgi:hypothetical protein